MLKHLRHVAPIAALAILLPAAAPEGEALVECDTDVDVIVEGESAAYDGTAGLFPDPNGTNDTGTSQAEVVTIAGTAGETALKATVTVVMTYDAPGDLELRLFDSSGAEVANSTAFNPTDGNVETATATVDICEEITVVAENYAGVPSSPVNVEISVEGKRPRTR